MARGTGGVATLVLAGLVGAAGCRDILGIDTRSEGPPPLALGEACGACVEAGCADAERACAADPGRGHLAVQFFDCSARQTANVTMTVPNGATLETPFQAAPGLFALYNVNPGCFDIIGHDELGRETHRSRLQLVADVLSWVFVFPSSAPPAFGYTCSPDFE